MNERKDAQMKEKSKKNLEIHFDYERGVGDCVREEGDACVVALCKEAI